MAVLPPYSMRNMHSSSSTFVNASDWTTTDVQSQGGATKLLVYSRIEVRTIIHDSGVGVTSAVLPDECT